MAPLISKTFMVITLWHLLTVHFFLCILHISEAESVCVTYIYIPCRHSVGGKKIPRMSCLACATEVSKCEVLEVRNYNSIMDEYLHSHGMKRVCVPPDGHCILHSWRLGLSEVKAKIEHEKLLHLGVTEIAENLSFYNEFLPNEDLISQLEEYAFLNHYQSTVVDLMVYSLASATCTTCIIFSAPQGVVQETVIEPREGIKSNCTPLV